MYECSEKNKDPPHPFPVAMRIISVWKEILTEKKFEENLCFVENGNFIRELQYKVPFSGNTYGCWFWKY